MEEDNRSVISKLGTAALGSIEVVGTSLLKGALSGDPLVEAIGSNAINLLNEARKNRKDKVGYAKIKLANGKFKMLSCDVNALCHIRWSQ